MTKSHIKTILTTITTIAVLRSVIVLTGATNPDFIRGVCRASDWYTKRQRRLCEKQSAFMKWVKTGVEEGLKECRRVMKDEKWNCSPLQWNDVFQKYGILKKISRETAFVQAITAAGVMHHVATGCLKDGLCPCHTVHITPTSKVDNYGADTKCSDGINKGAYISRNFMDPKPKTRHYDRVQAHNQEVGRRVVRETLRNNVCWCHGTSNACTTRTCVHRVSSMSVIADELWKRFRKAVKSKWNSKSKHLVKRNRRNEMVKKTQLTFSNNSPDFCDRNDDLGIMGTLGRACSLRSNGSDACNKLCCGRKTKQVMQEIEDKCCQLSKSLKVTCKICRKKKLVRLCL